ncbi:uncharacterized protein [Nicotiana tomentosiformis]|uniref:uncharacterized protein n=1 Tax=Nicotiana tomentosiformis TaxID=4098 RepID=UPI00388C4C92
MQQTLQVMHATDTESVMLASYSLRDVVVSLYETWEQSRRPLAPPTGWMAFCKAFLQQYLPIELRRARNNRFLWLGQGNMSVREYKMQFSSLARYSPSVVTEMSDRAHQFVGGLGPHLINECTTPNLNPNMDISRIQAYAQNMEDQKRQQRAAREHDRRQHKINQSIRNTGEFRGGFRPLFPRHPSYPTTSATLQFQDQRHDRTTYSG